MSDVCSSDKRITRQPMHVKRNNEERSYNHCCSGKAISITYSEFVFVALVIQYAIRMRNIVMCPVRLHSIFPHYLINGTILGKKKDIEHKMCIF